MRDDLHSENISLNEFPVQRRTGGILLLLYAQISCSEVVVQVW